MAYKAPLIQLSHVLIPIMQNLPFNEELIHPTVEMNYTIKSSDGSFEVIPNLAMILSCQLGSCMGTQPQVTYICKCAFS